MDLLVDIGNTNLKWAISDGHILGPEPSIAHAAGALAVADAWRGIGRPDAIRVANVAGPELGSRVRDTCLALWNREPSFVVTLGRGYGVTVAYARPETLGVDRWLAMVAAVARGLAPVLVVDCGTAVTLDALDAEGRHLGGLILPGLGLMVEALRAGTRIPGVALGGEMVDLLGTDTNACIRSGAIQATVGMIERVKSVLARDRGVTAAILLTGSDASRIAAELGGESLCERDLVLQGLALLRGD